MKWQLYDPETSSTYTLLINPQSANFSVNVKNVTHQAVIRGKRQVAFEGRRQPQTLSFGGTILEESEYEGLMELTEKRKQVRLTDDLDRVMWIYITRFQPQRQLHPGHPFYFTYSLDATILDWQ